MKRNFKQICTATLAAAAMTASAPALAQAQISAKVLGGDFSLNGLVRLEMGIKTTSEQNQYNQGSYEFNGVGIARAPGNPLTGWNSTLWPSGQIIPGLPISIPLPSAGLLSDVSYRGNVPNESATMTSHALRLEVSPALTWGDFSIVSRIRALYDPGGMGYADFDARDYQSVNGGISGGHPALYHGSPNYYGYRVDGYGDRSPIPLEWSGRNYMVDFPALFLQYNNGPMTVRVGNQSVAWGQAIFFRVFDTANGLDLRRKLILDRALEEYADERMSALGIRIGYQLNELVHLDAFGQQFVPSILPNPNSPYNVIPSQFTAHDRYKEGGWDDKLNYGLRVKGEFGQFSLQAMAMSRYNPMGSFRWSKSGVDKALPNTNALGLLFNQVCNVVYMTSTPGCGQILAQTPFEVAPAGVFSAEEWFFYAHEVRLDALEALNTAISDFPEAGKLFAVPVDNMQAANNQLDAFFFAGEGLHGHIERVYRRENVFGLGGTYLTEAEPGSVFDQIIINLEVSYTPERSFAYSGFKDLRQELLTSDEVMAALVVEKYHRFSQGFPATYLVGQYLYRSESDLVDRHLSGYGGTPGSVPAPNCLTCPGQQPQAPKGVNGAHYLAFAALQPFPDYIWELSAAVLIDVRGGVLVQPNAKWKPRGNFTLDLYYNYLSGNAWGSNRNNNLISTIDHADELGVRIGYQF
jgi:hypothetical protein